MYDGHGGHEVALYSSQKLPDFIKQTEAYKSGDYKKALIEAFMKFDATIASREVVAVLKEIAGAKENEANDNSSSEDEENVSNLYEEASMPIEQVIEKYQSGVVNPNLKKLQGDKLPSSPFLRARKDDDAPECSGSGSSKCADTSSDADVVSSTNSDVTSSVVTSETNHVDESKETNPTTSEIITSPDSSITPELKPEPDSKSEVNGETTVSSKSENECSSTTTQENGEVKPSKGKGKAIAKKASAEGGTRAKSLRLRNARQLYSKLLELEEESDTEDENDETFEGAASNSSSDNEDAAESSNAEGEEEEEDEDEDILDDEDDEFTRNITEEPGSDSGCTAVVALLKGNQLYVANAGDSRCIVCRNGMAVEMSFDHKPEDEPEMERIVKAGGKVTQDGRVNGGLNLSRAIGDHAYKQNKDLSDKEQMITALPDIKTLTVNTTEDEFMVLACDGIWNFMSSQEVVEFVRPRLQENKDKLSQICEEMFDHCLAPNTMGDGTGCDNMTAIIVQFKNSRLPKRSASPIPESEESVKRIRTAESVN